MLKTALAAAAIVLSVQIAASAPLETTPVGRIFHYLRTNIDGTEPEHIHVFRPDATHIEVYKMQEKCTSAALVTADLDLALGYAPRITGGRLEPNAKHKQFAFITSDVPKRTITMRIDLSDSVIVDAPKEIKQQATANAPFHIYDFDLSDLTIFGPGLTKAAKAFNFDLLLLWPPHPDRKLRYLGRADFWFRGEEQRDGRAVRRYEASGPAFVGNGGPIWFDKAEGHIVDAEWKIPNHAEYKDFKLKLQGIDDGGAEAWKRLLTAHFEGCK
ncbi:MAG: hypothetical protein JNL06_15070 [Alphaproteobacteria bacterium]|nr:hypothetical protein [Alphaproteobacteria bacterium]